MQYLYLAIAILAEVTAATALKASAEFTKVIPSIVVALGYGVSFFFMTLVLRTMPIGITYAVWSGVGIILVAIAGAVLYNQIPDLPAILGMLLIVIGVAVVFIFSKSVGQ